MIPRDYQIRAAEACAAAWSSPSGGRHPLLVMATGTGKTKTALFAAQGTRGRVLWLAHRKELVHQARNSLWYDRAQSGVVMANENGCDKRIVFGSFRTLSQPKRMEEYLKHGVPDLVVVDEAHHSVAAENMKVLQPLIAAGARLLGLTATPDRDDDLSLEDLWVPVFSFGFVEAIESGFLMAPYVAVERIPGFDETQVGGRRDYNVDELGEKLLAAHVVEHTVGIMGRTLTAHRMPRKDDSTQMSADGRHALVFTATVEQAQLTAKALCDVGWRAKVVCHKTPKRERDDILVAFQKGHINAVCNPAAYTEGVDLPECDLVVVARPTKSRTLYVQMIGRGARINAGKRDTMVIDLAGASEMHSLISAPALIGGSRCKTFPGGVHQFVEVDGKAKCECGARLPCYASLEAGAGGLHTWVDDSTTGRRTCKHCSKPQCKDSPSWKHEYTPIAGHRRQCMWCDVIVPNPLASLQSGERQVVEPPEPAAWALLHTLRDPVEAINLDEHGIIYLVGGQKRATPVWLPRRAKNPRPLTDGPVERWHAEEICADLIRKARKAWDPWKREVLAGGSGGDINRAMDFRRYAAVRAAETGVSEWRR
ncbi:MAG: DEAD/DEAH box helicase [Hyphomicrobium sp.]|nr:DEAD/DEAH box helicase [Hyphomicrobium sp.]